MVTFVIAFVLVALAMAGMASSLIVADRRLHGSCGGLARIEGLESACDMCAKPCRRRRKALRDFKSGDATGSRPR